MTRGPALVWSAAFLLLAPGTMAGLIPWAITGWRVGHIPIGLAAVGGPLIGVGIGLLLDCFIRFAWQGRGTPAPIAPTDRLVITGPYRRVRNPMYVAVTAMIFGQAALFADLRLLAWGLVFWLITHAFVVLYEEPSLKRAFPRDYAAYFAAVPRWIPRLRPWRPA